MTRRVSVIATVLNEEATIGLLLDSLLSQARAPDEIVICDAGSTDRTLEIISGYAARGIPVTWLAETGASRARGRNLAIRQATGDVIASVDAGCAADPQWLARLVAPLESEDPPDVVGGYYRAAPSSALEEAVAAATVPDASEVDPETFLPSSRSVAFTRGAWARVGGYPETVSVAEDTAFGLRLREAGAEFEFVPNAIVRWRMQRSLGAVFHQFYRYAKGDGELGHWFPHYAKARAALIAVAAAAVLTVSQWWGGLTFPALALLYWIRYTLRAWRRGARWQPGLLSPVVSLTADLANLTGYIAGRRRRRPRAAPLPNDRPLSIAQVTYTYQPIAGGADVYAAQLGELIAAAGHQHVVYQRRAETTAADVRFVPNPWRGRSLEFWTQALGLCALRRELLAHDIVICHYPHFLLAVHLLSLGRGRPVRVGLSHGVFWDDHPGSLRGRLKAWLARLAFRRAHLYIANDTEFLRAMGLAISPQHRMRSEIAPGVWFIPNGVDPEQFRPVPPVPDIAALNPILVPRNLFRSRGIHLAIEAFELFRKDFPETKLLIVGGGGQPGYAADLHRRIEWRGLTDSVLFHGAVPHDELPAIYSSARLTLIPSLSGEGTSLSALESMACGTATICTDVAGLRDLPGPHARPTPVGLAEVMREVYPERVRVGEEQRALVLSTYSLDLWCQAWQAALATLPVVPPQPEEPESP